MGPSPKYHPPKGEEFETSVEHGLPLWAGPAVGYCSRRRRPSPMWGSRFVGAPAVGPLVGEQKPLCKTPLRGNPSPQRTYQPTSAQVWHISGTKHWMLIHSGTTTSQLTFLALTGTNVKPWRRHLQSGHTNQAFLAIINFTSSIIGMIKMMRIRPEFAMNENWISVQQTSHYRPTLDGTCYGSLLTLPSSIGVQSTDFGLNSVKMCTIVS